MYNLIREFMPLKGALDSSKYPSIFFVEKKFVRVKDRHTRNLERDRETTLAQAFLVQTSYALFALGYSNIITGLAT